MSINNRVYAFWRYDVYPYVLWSVGTVTSLGDFQSDTFHTTVARANLVAVHDTQYGKQLGMKLEVLKQNHSKLLTKINEKAVEDVYALLPKLKTIKEHT